MNEQKSKRMTVPMTKNWEDHKEGEEHFGLYCASKKMTIPPRVQEEISRMEFEKEIFKNWTSVLSIVGIEATWLFTQTWMTFAYLEAEGTKQRRKKKLPKWARGQALGAAAEKEYFTNSWSRMARL